MENYYYIKNNNGLLIQKVNELVYIKEYPFRTDTIYYPGAIFNGKYGDYKIIGKHKNKYNYYIVEFLKDGVQEISVITTIKKLLVKNRNYPAICGIAYLGYEHNTKTDNRIYKKWHSMFNRCYNKNSSSYKDYGAKSVTVSDSWRCYSIFHNDFKSLENYDKWNKDNSYYELDKDVLCKKLNLDNKIYSKNTCLLLDRKTNSGFEHKRGVFRAIKNSGDVFEFTGIVEFSIEHKLHYDRVVSCINGINKEFKGWRFEIKELYKELPLSCRRIYKEDMKDYFIRFNTINGFCHKTNKELLDIYIKYDMVKSEFTKKDFFDYYIDSK